MRGCFGRRPVSLVHRSLCAHPTSTAVVCPPLLSGRNGAMTQGFRPLTCSFPAYDGIYDDCAWLMAYGNAAPFCKHKVSPTPLCPLTPNH